MLVLIIIGAIFLMIIKFVFDGNKASNLNSQNGGLINKHKAFVEYCDNPLSVFRMELVENTGSVLEYRLAIQDDSTLKGYIHFGLKDRFAVIVFCSAVSINGYRHQGFMREIKNWRSMNSNNYNQIFESMIASMTSTDDFSKLNF